MAGLWECDGTGEVLAHGPSSREEPHAAIVSHPGQGEAGQCVAGESRLAPTLLRSRRRDTAVEDAVIDLRVLIARRGTAAVPEHGADSVAAAVRLPIRARRRAVGTLRLVGPVTGECTREDRRRLAAFADQIGVAYVTFLLLDSPGGRVTWRQVQTCAGIGLVVVGLSLILGAAWALGARALPLAWLPSRPGVWTGVCLTGTGALLASLRR